MNENILNRRRELLGLRTSGFQLSQAVKALSTKYGVSQRQLYNDWKSRSKWMNFFIDFSKGEEALRDILARHESIYAKAASDYANSRNDSAKVGALRLMAEINRDMFEFVVDSDILQRITVLEEDREVKGVNKSEYR